MPAKGTNAQGVSRGSVKKESAGLSEEKEAQATSPVPPQARRGKKGACVPGLGSPRTRTARPMSVSCGRVCGAVPSMRSSSHLRESAVCVAGALRLSRES